MIKHRTISSNRGVPWVSKFDYYSGLKDADCPLTDWFIIVKYFTFPFYGNLLDIALYVPYA
jgi:hypothetical protein